MLRICLYDLTKQERRMLLNNRFVDILSQYINGVIIHKRLIWSKETKQPIRSCKEFMESGVDKAQIERVKDVIEKCVEDPSDSNLAAFQDASKYFQFPCSHAPNTKELSPGFYMRKN